MDGVYYATLGITAWLIRHSIVIQYLKTLYFVLLNKLSFKKIKPAGVLVTRAIFGLDLAVYVVSVESEKESIKESGVQ